MMKVWSCERLQHRCCCSKVLEGLWPVNQAQPTWNCELELCFLQRRAGKCSGQTDSRITLFIVVLVRGSLLKL